MQLYTKKDRVLPAKTPRSPRYPTFGDGIILILQDVAYLEQSLIRKYSLSQALMRGVR